MKELSERQARWIPELSQYHFKIEYRLGKQGGKPDALTRREGDPPRAGNKRHTGNVGILLPMERYWDIPETQEERTTYWKQQNFETRTKAKYRKPVRGTTKSRIFKKNLDKGKKNIKGIVPGLCQWRDDLLWYQGRIWIPNDEGIRTTLITKHHDIPQARHGGTAKTTELISRRYYWPKIREDIKQFIQTLRHMSKDQSGPTCTLRIAPAK